MSRNRDDVSIELRGRADRLLYSQGGRSLTIDCELLLAGSASLVVYANSIRQWDDGTAISADEKRQIIENVCDDLRPRWGEIEIDGN